MNTKKAAVGFIFITLLIDVTGIGIIIPVLPKLIMELTGLELSEASRYGGWLLFAYAFFQFLCAPIIGALSDRYGRRPVLLTSLFGFGIDYVFLALAPTIGWLFIGRIIAGILGASFTTGAAYIADVSTPEKRAQNFGLIGAAFGLGFIIGPVVGGLLGQFGSRVPFYAAALLTLLNWLYGYFILPESLPEDKRRAFSWKRANPIGSLVSVKRYPLVIGLLLAMSFLYVASHAVQSTWTFYTMFKFEWEEDMVGYSLGLVGILSAVVQGGLIRWIIPKIGEKYAVIVGVWLYIVGFVLFAFATKGWHMMAILIPYCLGGISGPALQGMMSNAIPANEQGELQGAVTGMMSATSIIGPPLMTGLFAYYTSDSAPFQFAGAPLILAAFLSLIGLFWTVVTLRKNGIK